MKDVSFQEQKGQNDLTSNWVMKGLTGQICGL